MLPRRHYCVCDYFASHSRKLRSYLFTKPIDGALVFKSNLEVTHPPLNEWAQLLDGMGGSRSKFWLQRKLVAHLIAIRRIGVNRHEVRRIIWKVRRAT